MNLLESILSAQGGSAVRKMASQFGLEESQAKSAVESILPALTGGLKKNMASPDGLDSLVSALKNGNHARYVDDSDQITSEDTVMDGNRILGHILGGKERSREVAAEASQQTGIGASILEKMLPMIAAAAMGGMAKKVLSNRDSGGAGGFDLGSLLGSFLGSGSQTSQRSGGGLIGSILGKLFGRR